MPRKPLVAVSACIREIRNAPFHAVNDKYLRAVALVAEATPVILPAIGDTTDLCDLIAQFDGFLFTGSPSNVLPAHYDGPASRPEVLHDARRDATTLPLLRALLEADTPVLALCRGNQELNVACGGTLHQHVQEVPGKLDHRGPSRDLPAAIRYSPTHHTVRLREDGVLARLADAPEPSVNSLHQQGIDRLGAGLEVEATAPDGLIEGVRYARSRSWILGVQWHPEACVDVDPFSRAIFEEFGRQLRGRTPARH